MKNFKDITLKDIPKDGNSCMILSTKESDHVKVYINHNGKIYLDTGKYDNIYNQDQFDLFKKELMQDGARIVGYDRLESMANSVLRSLGERTGDDILVDRAKELVDLIRKNKNDPALYTELQTCLRSWPSIRSNDVGSSAVRGKDIILGFKFSDIADKAIKSIQKDLDVKIHKNDSCTLQINV
jgi:hypothetical protein